MASLEISFLSGKTQKIELSKKQPVSIGSHASNDLQIEDKDVAAMQCRISWNKKHYEILAATSEGIEINGTLSGRSLLKNGDLIRIGEADILFSDKSIPVDLTSPLPDVTGHQDSSMFDLKPVSTNEFDTLIHNSQKQPEKKQSDKESKSTKKKKNIRSRKEKVTPKPIEEEIPDDDLDLESAAELLLQNEPEELQPPPEQTILPRSNVNTAIEENAETKSEVREEGHKTLSLKDRIRQRSSRNAVRPGERQVVRSPFVLSLTGGTILLALTAFTFWFVIGRDTAKRHFDSAVQEMDAGKYSQAIQLFDKFLVTYSKSDYADEARILRSKSLVEKEISGSTPAWNAGLKATNEFIKKHRDDSNFKELHPILVEYGQKIALGAVETAGRTKERDLLTVSKNAESIFNRYSPPDTIPTEALAKIKAGYEKAEAEILRKEVFDVAVKEIEESIKQNNSLQALARRRHLLDRYPYYKNDRKMTTVLTQIIALEKELIQTNNEPVIAVTTEFPETVPQSVTLALHTRSRSNAISDGRNVFAIANGSCFGIDSITGDPVWRRPIGLDSPFSPLTFSGSQPVLLLFDTRHQELLCVTQKNGNLIWRQKLPSRPTGKPLMHQGQFLISCSSGDLLSVESNSGTITAQLKFAQPLVGAPGLVYGEQSIAVAGYEGVIYLISLRPFECQKVSPLGHRPGTIGIPVIGMGKLLLVCENDRTDSAILHVLDGNGLNASLNELEQYRIRGHVQSMPVIRGRQLFFPTVPERITAFTVSDEPGKRKLTEIASYQLQSPLSCQIYLSAGSGGQLWMSSSALRKFLLLNTGLQVDKRKIAEGLGAQPMQLIGNNLYLARRLLSSKSVIFSIANRDTMSSSWKSILGTDLLATYAEGNNGLVCITSDGDVFRLRVSDFEQGSSTFKEKPTTQLKLPEGLTEPLKTTQLAGGKIAVYCGSPAPTLWILNAFGQLEQTIKLQDPLEAMPILLGDGIALPFQNKIAVFRKGQGLNTVQEFIIPNKDNADVKWKQLIPTEKDQCLAITTSGQTFSLQYRTSPARHLAILSMSDNKQPIDFKAAIGKDSLALTDASGLLQLLDPKTAQQKAKLQLPSPATNDLWISENLLFVETKENISCLDLNADLKKLWDLKLTDTSLAGSPSTIDQKLFLALKNGSLLSVDPKSGKIRSKAKSPLPNSGAIVNLKPLMLVPTVDGSFYRIDQVLKQEGQAAL